MGVEIVSKDFYVYLHRRATDGSVFYVGKGHGRRAWANNKASKRSAYWHRIARKHGLIVEIVQSGLQEWYAFELERDLIAYYGRESLCNLTDGGDGLINPSDCVREKIGKASLGRRHTEETKALISEASKRNALLIDSDASSRKGWETRTARGNRGHSAEARAKMSAAKMGRKMPERSAEHRAKLSAALMGKRGAVHSDETRRKMSEAQRLAHARRRAASEVEASRYGEGC